LTGIGWKRAVAPWVGRGYARRFGEIAVSGLVRFAGLVVVIEFVGRGG
jgi:hypothetical protein